MTRLSLIDKLGVIVNLSKGSGLLIVILLILVALGIGLTFISPKNEKRYKSFYLIIVSIIAVLIVISNYSTLGKMFKFMMDNFFIVALFPNFAIYIAAIIAMNIIVWVSVFNYRSARIIRNLNIFIYIIMNYLLALLLHVIVNNKLDVYSQESIYKNNDARALIELSSTVFIIWIIFLVIYKIILIYLRKDYKPKIKKIIVHKKVKVLPANFQPMNTPKVIYGKAPQRERIIVKEVKQEKQKERFTLEEYKLFSEILKSQKKKTQSNNTKVNDNKYKATDNQIKEELYGNPKKEVLPEKQLPEEDNSITQIIRVDQLIDNLNKEQDENKKKYDSEPLSDVIENNNYRDIQKQEIIRMEEERRELLKKEQQRIEKEKQDRILEQQRQEEVRQKHLREMAEKERLQKEQERQQRELEEQREREKQKQQELENRLLQEKLQEEEREQEKLTELEMLYRSIRQ